MDLLTTGIVVFITLMVLAYWISTFNFYKSIQEAIKTQWSNIITEYERRVDLFLNLSKTVKSLKDHEKGTLVEVTRMRSCLPKEKKGKQIETMKRIDGLINALIERYPKIVADKIHSDLINEIRITEDRINAGRTGYNEVVREMNTTVMTFPSNIIANIHRIRPEKYYDTTRTDVSGKAPGITL